MRFIELHPDPSRVGFELHPRVTVLRGLQPFARVQIVGLAHAAAMGEKSEWAGRVEVHGVRMSLDDALELMGETAPAALVVDAASLPPTRSGIGESDDRADHTSVPADEGEGIEAEIAELAAELSSAGKLRGTMHAHVASAAALIDEDASHRLDRADGDLRRAAAAAEKPDPWSGCDDVAERVAELDGLVTTFDQQLEGLPSGDRAMLAAAAATARASLVTGEVIAPNAAALHEVWDSLLQRLAGLESRVEAGGAGTEALSARLAAARAEVAVAEEAAMPRPVTSEEADQLTELHDRVIDYEAKASRGVRRAAARVQLEETQGLLHDVLETLGYPTWAAYRMGNGMAGVADDALAAYRRALEDLELAETEWAGLMTRLERDTELQEVLSAIDGVHREAAELLGSDPLARSNDRTALSTALSEMVVDAATVAVDPQEAVADLRAVLTESGAAGLGQVESPGAIVALADSWLCVLGAADAAAVRVLRDRERATDELAVLSEAGDAGRPDGLEEQHAAVREAEAAVAESRSALLEHAGAHLELHVLAATELSLAEEHDRKLGRLEAAGVLAEQADRRAAAGERAGRVPLAERVPRGSGGPIPVVVAMGNADAALLDVLLDLPEDVQFLIVGDADGIEEWAADAGSEQVGIVDPGVLV